MTMAARIGDQTAHGGAVVMGFPTVLIGNMPASRIGDNHVCPMVTGVVPHVGGPIALGAFTVLVGNMPQARSSDMCVCVGPPDVIAVGAPTVLVGMAGSGSAGVLGFLAGLALAGASVLSRLLGGGYPRTIVGSDGKLVTQYSKCIVVNGSPEYQATVVSDLNSIRQQAVGKQLLEELDASGRSVTIEPIPAGDQQDNGFTTRVQGADALMRSDGTPGPGSDSIIGYNPSYEGRYVGEDGKTYTSPPHETLGHELIHANHNAHGENLRNVPDPVDPHDNSEEARTIGVHGYEKEPISERKFSEGDGRSARPDHDSVVGSTYQDHSGQWHEGDATGGSTPIDAPPGGGRPNH